MNEQMFAIHDGSLADRLLEWGTHAPQSAQTALGLMETAFFGRM